MSWLDLVCKIHNLSQYKNNLGAQWFILWFWFDFCFTALQHVISGAVNYPNDTVPRQLTILSVHSFASN